MDSNDKIPDLGEHDDLDDKGEIRTDLGEEKSPTLEFCIADADIGRPRALEFCVVDAESGRPTCL